MKEPHHCWGHEEIGGPAPCNCWRGNDHDHTVFTNVIPVDEPSGNTP